jgi:CBS domain-containing protein
MDKIALSSQLEQTTYAIECFDREENFSSGSGVAINNRGDILTAAHVISGKLPIKEKDVKDPNLSIIARTKIGPFRRYYPLIGGITMSNEYLKEPLTVDVAVLRPFEGLSDGPYLRIADYIPPVGTEVLMAGFPDELELPFTLDRSIDMSHPTLRDQRDHLLRTLKIVRRLLMIKSGMIGNQLLFAMRDPSIEIKGAVFYVDNVMHSGSSGGPVVTTDGQIVGVISKRAVTDASSEKLTELAVPSGSAVAVTANFLLTLGIRTGDITSR